MTAWADTTARRAARRIGAAVIAACLALVAAPASAAPAPDAQRVARLARDVERVEAIRTVKRLQTAYAQFQQFGLWDQMAGLFAEDGEAVWGADMARGRANIAAFLQRTRGGGRPGLAAGALDTQLIFTPVVVLAPDGLTARARWREITLSGRSGANADWAGGVQETDYVKQGGVWKIARHRYTPELAGPYETGWRNVEADAKILPYWFTPEQAGTPVPAAPANLPLPRVGVGALPALERRAEALVDEDKVRNLQNAYGYYVDQRMWDDVADLFTPAAVLEVDGVGAWDGQRSIRRGLERDGPLGLHHGELNDRLQLNTVVTIAPNGREATARGVEWGMIGKVADGSAYWTLAVFENRYVKINGTWRIGGMHIYPTLRSDYYQGWARSRLPEPTPAPAFAPDRLIAARGEAIPAFSYRHPVSGLPIAFPAGSQAAGAGRAATSSIPPATGPPRATLSARIAEAERKLAVARAYDAVENLNTAFGEYLTDQQGDFLGRMFARNGMRQRPFTGFHIGYDHIRRAAEQAWGPPRSPRTTIRIHLRTQPVIDVAPDGRSANLRSRLLLFPTQREAAGSVYNGMYNDQAALEDGTFKLWNVAIDDQMFVSASYKDGWARVREPAPAAAPATTTTAARAEGAGPVPPDIPLAIAGERERGMRGGIGEPIEWPEIKPVWFHYKNPVSGRTPPRYWPDCVPCLARPDVSLKQNGY